MQDFVPSKEFLKIFNLLEKSSDHFFITGQAGTGKSTILKYFRENSSKNIAVLAPTGLAAVNVNGQTIHSFFKFPLNLLDLSQIKIAHNKKLYKNLDTIIIDEVSMVRADVIDAIDTFLRLNGPNKRKSFGGVQMVFVGDLFQLPPVLISSERDYFLTKYPSPYFLSSNVFGKIKLKMIELSKIYRQKDQHFIDILNKIRVNEATWTEINELNKRFEPNFEIKDNDFYITLTATNRQSELINHQKLDQIKKPIRQFSAEVEGNFAANLFPNDAIVKLKVGSQVLFVKNDSKSRWVNGTIGKVVRFDGSKVVVMTMDGIVEVEMESWDMTKFELDPISGKLDNEVIGTFRQLPLRLAWAITIHKSQGQTFDKVVLDITGGIFAHGQLYVALSRCSNLQGLVLRKKIYPGAIIIDEQIVEFYRQIKGNSLV